MKNNYDPQLTMFDPIQGIWVKVPKKAKIIVR